MESCRERLKRKEILLFYSEYIFSLPLYVVNNKLLLTKSLVVHNHDSRCANDFHLHITDLTKYQIEAHYAGIKTCNHRSTHIKRVANKTQVFKSALKWFLLSNSFNSTAEYFNFNE